MFRIKIEISGHTTKYFLKKLIKLKIKLYDIKYQKNKLIIIVDKDDLDRIYKVKGRLKIKILNRYGYSKLSYLIYKYRFLILCFILSLFLLLTLSRIIFSVEIICRDDELKEIVRSDLENFGIKKYHFIKSYKRKEEIKKKILESEKESIEYIEIDRIGTKYKVLIDEKKINKEKEDNTPRNIVAKKSAMILKIEAEEGEVKKKIYDYVEKGDIIISGTIMNKTREVKKVKAKGKILGEIWYKVEVEIPIKYKEEELTGSKKKVLTLMFLNKEYSLELKKYKNYSFNETKLFSNPLLPIRLSILDKKESIVTIHNYNINNVDKKAISLAKEKLGNIEIIYEKVLKKKLKRSTIVVDIFFKAKEDITDYETITNLELREDVENE